MLEAVQRELGAETPGLETKVERGCLWEHLAAVVGETIELKFTNSFVFSGS